MPLSKDFRLTVSNTMVDENARQVALSASSIAMTELLILYGNEYMLVLRMTEDGTQVACLEEFVDRKYPVEFMIELRKMLAVKEEECDGRRRRTGTVYENILSKSNHWSQDVMRSKLCYRQRMTLYLF